MPSATNAIWSQLSIFEAVCNITREKLAGMSEECSESIDLDDSEDRFFM